MSDREAGAVREFVAEAEEIMEDLFRDVSALAEAATHPGGPPPDLVNAVFRSAHSLKGLAGMVGFADVSGLAHHLENLLDLLRLGKVPLEPATVTALWDGIDHLSLLIRHRVTGDPPPDCTGVMARLAAIVPGGTVSPSGSPIKADLPDRITGALTEFEEHRLSETIRNGRRLTLLHASFPLDTFDRQIEGLIAYLKERGEVISTLPSPGQGNTDAIDFTILVGWDALPADLPATVRAEEVPLLPVGGGAGPASPVALSSPAQTDDPAVSARSLSGTIRVDIARLDELMAVVGELMAAHTGLTETLARASGLEPGTAVALSRGTARFGVMLNELQHGIMDLRLVPVRTLYDKVARVARKLTTGEGRDLELLFTGAETRLDKQIVEDISDPLMHIIRNAVDHGIEAPDQRVAAGKPSRGSITVSAAQRGNRIVIEVADDGHGIDLERVRRRARERGLLGRDEEVSDTEALQLIFLPGFSTNDGVSELSGRGVGLDVVKNNIAALSGDVSVSTAPGRGSRFTITLPITLAIIRTLIVGTGSETYGLPVNAIQETVAVSAGDVITIEGSEVLPVREMILPVVRLDRLLGTTAAKAMNDGYAIVAGVGERRVGIMVDDLKGQQDLVLSSLGTFLDQVPCIAGAANLGEETTILVLDVAAIVDEAGRGAASHVS